MNYNQYKEEAYKTAKEHGFHEQAHSDEHLKCLVISELMEAVEADRKGKRADIDAYLKGIESGKNVANTYRHDTDIYRQTRPEKVFQRHIKDTLEDELADACIRLFDLAGVRNIDIYFAGQIAAEISPQKRFTENILTITRFISGGTEGDPDDLMVRINYGLSMIFTLAKDLGIDIQKHIELKMAYNSSRPHKHGKGY